MTTIAAFSEQDALSSISKRDFSTSTSAVSKFQQRHKYLINEPNQDWHPEIRERLQDLIGLEAGWDGYQGEPVRFENANFALKILESICLDDTPPPQIVPGSSGDLQIEWHTYEAEIELHVLAPNKVDAWIANEETGPEGKDHFLTTDFTVIAKQIRRMTEQASDPTARARH